jgi:hypothetical protein
MKSRHEFRPSLGALEDRKLLSHVHARHPFSVVTAGLNLGPSTIRQGRQAPIVAMINASFDQFVLDYGQARSAYYGSISKQTATVVDTGAFKVYTQQRVNLLAEQLTNSLLQTSASTAYTFRHPYPVTIVPRRINGATGATLANALSTTVPAPGSSPTTIALDSLAQDTAVEAARVTMINGADIIKTGAFGYSKSKH